MNTTASDVLRERLSDVQHDIWLHWMKYLFKISKHNTDGSVTISAENVRHWQRQVNTSYDDLSEREKDSDREQADKILTVLRKDI